MKKKTRNRIEILILSLIALAGFIYVNIKESQFDRQMKELNQSENTAYRQIEMDGKQILIPTE